MVSNTSGYRRSPRWKVSWLFIATALACLPFADLSINTYDPWAELGRLLAGLLQPSISGIEKPFIALLQTVAFALLGVASGSLVGFILAQLFHWRLVRIVCASLRAVHELFWALIFLQIFGLHPLTGLLALGLPYAATFAKVYAEILEEGDRRAYETIRGNAGLTSAFFMRGCLTCGSILLLIPVIAWSAAYVQARCWGLSDCQRWGITSAPRLWRANMKKSGRC